MQKSEQALVIAHELSHKWFGDLVTMAWWNDLWLNEAFATWAEAKIADHYRPSIEGRLELIAGLSSVMDTDSLGSARAIRQPVTSTSEAEEAFDPHLRPGAAVLAMMEHAIGETVFQKGVRAYLSPATLGRTATTEDLLRALNLASGKDVARLAAGFLDRPGVPRVAVSTMCDKSTETVSLRQDPWRRLGQAVDAARPEGHEVAEPSATAPWWIPISLLGATGDQAATLLAGPKGRDRAPAVRPLGVSERRTRRLLSILARRQILGGDGVGRGRAPHGRAHRLPVEPLGPDTRGRARPPPSSSRRCPRSTTRRTGSSSAKRSTS